MKTLFQNVPIGTLIRFNGCEAVKLDEEHVKFLRDCDGKPIDYTKDYMQKYARCSQVAIGGTPVTILNECAGCSEATAQDERNIERTAEQWHCPHCGMWNDNAAPELSSSTRCQSVTTRTCRT